MEWIGYAGLVALVLSGIPQSIDTIRTGRCEVNLTFLILSCLGIFCLMVYAIPLSDTVFSLLCTDNMRRSSQTSIINFLHINETASPRNTQPSQGL